MPAVQHVHVVPLRYTCRSANFRHLLCCAGDSAGSTGDAAAPADCSDCASPSAAPAGSMGGIYEGVPAGGPTEPLQLIDEGDTGGNPPAAAPQHSADMAELTYRVLVLGLREYSFSGINGECVTLWIFSVRTKGERGSCQGTACVERVLLAGHKIFACRDARNMALY